MKRNIFGILVILIGSFFSYLQAASIFQFKYAGENKTELNTFGSHDGEIRDLAIRIDDPSLAGCQITKIRMYLRDCGAVSNAKVWVSSVLNVENNVNVPDIYESEEITVGSGKYLDWQCDLIEYSLTQPVVMGEEPVFVGCSYLSAPIYGHESIVVYKNDNPNGQWYRGSKTSPKWSNSYFKGYSLVMVVDMEATEDKNIVNIGEIDKCYALADTTFTVNVNLVNPCGETVQNIDYSYSVDGGEVVSKTMDLSNPIVANPMFEGRVALMFDAISEVGKHRIALRIDGVNGEENTSPRGFAEFDVNIVPVIPVHRALCEEFTGLWCKWCPRGLAAMEAINRRYGDDVVIMSYHYNDALSVTSAYPVPVSNWPKMSIDRFPVVDPYHGTKSDPNGLGVFKDIESRMQMLPVASIEINNVEIGESAISFNIETVFVEDLDNVNYQIGYAVTANGLTTTSGQQNEYSGDGSWKGTPLEKYTKLPKLIYGLEYDDVVVNVGEYKGVVNSLPTSMKCGDKYVLSDSVSYKNIKYCEDPEMLVINAFIIDKNTSQIINANKAYASEKGRRVYEDEKEEELPEVDPPTEENPDIDVPEEDNKDEDDVTPGDDPHPTPDEEDPEEGNHGNDDEGGEEGDDNIEGGEGIDNGIDQVTGDCITELMILEVYDVNGRRININTDLELEKGFYIVVTNKGTRKIRI